MVEGIGNRKVFIVVDGSEYGDCVFECKLEYLENIL